MAAPEVRLVPTTRPLPSDETIAEGLDRVASALRVLAADVDHLRRRLDSEEPHR